MGEMVKYALEFSCCTSRCDGCLQEKHYQSHIRHSIQGISLISTSNYVSTSDYGYSDLDIWHILLKWTTGTYHFTKNNWQYPFPMIKFNLSMKLRILENLYPWWQGWQFLNTYFWGISSDKISNIMNGIFCYYVMKYIHIWNICITQWTRFSK